MKISSEVENDLKELKKILLQLSGSETGVYVEKSFQTPNFVTDFLDYYLTSVESKVLYHFIRSILGWKKRIGPEKNVVSISKIVHGHKKDTGEDACLGCGLSYETVERTADQLCQLGILKKEQRTQRGCVYGLNFDTSQYDIETMLNRVNSRKTTNKKRMQAARQANPLVK